MEEFFKESAFAGVTVSLAAYMLGVHMKKRWGWGFLNPLLLSILVTILFLLVANVDYATYQKGAGYLGWLLTPATVSLALPLYEQLPLLRANWKAVALGILAGVLASLSTVFLLARLMGLGHREYVTLLPKSITTAIGMSVSEELGGYVAITTAVIIITGVLGNVLAEPICRIFGIKHPIARGLAIGSASHAVGTAKAMEMGEVEGAMSSLSIVAAGILTVLLASLFANLI